MLYYKMLTLQMFYYSSWVFKDISNLIKKNTLKCMTRIFQATFYEDYAFWFVCHNYILNWSIISENNLHVKSLRKRVA